ncbi:putative sarcosine oxidase subunit gamma [Octadecabacter antarcticus 307]|uniref:Putative sarcosine oxidase subunit gamma n=1 Tax=Octadecabacter antarcticus 307 TaxID=391626 RepID=M9R4Y8_9RHOB|nr:sarcosine oxidase subunit gamma [Octadecabacter antarcticus]AGI66833.1 putative sarcosine oxidase subunit gamma [Octadecabacter antarcticus 307]
MVKLIANSPCAGLLPKTIGTVSFTEIDVGQMTLVAPFRGQKKSVSDVLKSAIGVGFPAPNRTIGTTPRAVWCGKGQALIMGADCPDLDGAACVDHSDAWAIVLLDGADATAILARLTPIDLRLSMFKRGHTARTLIGHMTGGITRLGLQSFEVMVMRSMAATLVHDLTQAAENMAARAGSPDGQGTT